MSSSKSIQGVTLREEDATQTGVASNPLRTDPTGATTQPVSAASLPLPSGAATAANQATIIGHIDTLESLLTSLDGKDFATQTTLAAQLNITLTALRDAITGTAPNSNTIYDLEQTLESIKTFLDGEDFAHLSEQQTQTTALQLLDDVVHAFNAAFSKASAIGGQLDDASTVLATEGNIAPVRITPARAQHVSLRSDDAGGSEIGNLGNPLRIDPTGDTPQPVVFSRSASVDAFNRVRVSSVQTLLDVRFDIDDLPLLLDKSTTGSATITRDTDESCLSLATTTASGDKAVVQSFRSLAYRPGKSTTINASMRPATPQANMRQRYGLFNDNDGVFFESEGTTIYTTIRSKVSGSVVDTRVAQSSWNMDTFDGTGPNASNPSGIELDPSLVQLIVIDMQWLGVGQVRFGFVYNGEVYYVHQIDHANIAGNTTVYMRTANLPFRAEIENLAATSSASEFNIICSNVSVEGTTESSGIPRTFDRGISTVSTNQTKVPLYSFRLRSGYEHASIEIKQLLVACTTSADFRWELALNPTVTGGPAASYTAVPNSALEYATNQTGIVSGGTVIYAGYAQRDSGVVLPEIASLLAPGVAIDGTRDVFTLSVQTIANNAEDFVGGLTYLEVI